MGTLAIVDGEIARETCCQLEAFLLANIGYLQLATCAALVENWRTMGRHVRPEVATNLITHVREVSSSN